jgi:hypothetical protein
MPTHTFAYSIKNQWINMSVYFINFMYRTRKPFGDTTLGTIVNSLLLGGALQLSLQIYKNIPFLISIVSSSLIKKSNQTIAEQYLNKIIEDFNLKKEKNVYVCQHITQPNRLKDNNDLLGGKQRNSKWFASGDYIKTKFIKLDKTDIITFFGNNDNGFAYNKNILNNPTNYNRQSNTASSFNTNITNQERDDNNTNIYNNDNLYYFLKATNNNDVIRFLIGAGII